MVERVRADLAIAKIERDDARIEETDVEGILAFAEHVIVNTAALLANASRNPQLFKS